MKVGQVVESGSYDSLIAHGEELAALIRETSQGISMISASYCFKEVTSFLTVCVDRERGQRKYTNETTKI